MIANVDERMPVMGNKICCDRGFTLVEMIVVMAIFVVVIGITGDAFNRIVSRAFLLSKNAESNISGIVGLELMRVDVESAGYGLPWGFTQSINYSEASADPGLALNDSARTYSQDITQNTIPRAVMSMQAAAGTDPNVVMEKTDVLVVRSQSVATNAAAKRWTYVESQVLPTVNPTPSPHVWSSENLVATDRIIMLQPIVNTGASNFLVTKGASSADWSNTFTNYKNIGEPTVYNDVEKKMDAFVIYGVNADTDLRMPFNRADYYVRQPATTEQGWVRLPQRCNKSTGVLFKGIVGHTNGSYQELPLLECVLDMQVVYELRTPGSSMLVDTNDISAFTPKEVREQVKAIKIYILTHDGGLDRNFKYPRATIGVGPGDGIVSASGSTYDFAARSVPDWQNYRWRVYQIVARPNNLAGSIAK